MRSGQIKGEANPVMTFVEAENARRHLNASTTPDQRVRLCCELSDLARILAPGKRAKPPFFL